MTESQLTQKHAEAYAAWKEFLQVWPIHRLRTMTLDDYSKTGSQDSFTYWLEDRLAGSGSIRGGSAFKFGVFSRRSRTDKENAEGLSYSAEHGWYSKFGATAESAFQRIRSVVVSVAEAAEIGNLDAVEASELGDTVTWKIAFHYQDQQLPRVVDVFKKVALCAFLNVSTMEAPLSVLHQQALQQRHADEGMLEFGTRVWSTWAAKEIEVWKLSHGAGSGFTPAELLSLRASHLAVIHKSTGREQADRFRKAPIGTLFYLCHGNSMQLLGRFVADVEPSIRGDGGWLQRRYEVLRFSSDNDRFDQTNKNWTPRGNSTFWQVPRNELLEFENLILGPYFGLTLSELANLSPMTREESGRNDTRMQVSSNLDETRVPGHSMGPLNRILYGPPGTGKTYRAVAEAVAIVEGRSVEEVLAPAAYQDTKKRFDEYRAEGRIEFVTFHPSYSYQDFVEGIRPQTTANEGLSYDVEPGVLKQVAQAARANWESSRAPSGVVISEEGRFERAMDHLLADIEESESGHMKAKLYRGYEGEISAGPKERSLKMSLLGYPTVYSLPKHQLKALWMRRSEIRAPRDAKVYNASFFWAALNLLQEIDNTLGLPTSAEPVPLLRFVLLIDEINRGNIAKIFGELITLVEDDKRLGNTNQLTARLPYSLDEVAFGLPPNLFILGTMNTADRSIALMDTALRRRFSFVELMPDAAVISPTANFGVDMGALLNTINARVEYLFDREHTIGHAYFCGVNSFDELAERLKNKVIPLLQEYFHEDWSKIRLVFRDGRGKEARLHVVREEPMRPMELFGMQGDELEPRCRYAVANLLTLEMVRAIYQ